MTDKIKGRVLAERLFKSGKVKRPTWDDGEPLYVSAWKTWYSSLRGPNHPFGNEADVLAIMAIVWALNAYPAIDDVVRSKDGGQIQWMADSLEPELVEESQATNDLLALALLACRVFGIDESVEEKR